MELIVAITIGVLFAVAAYLLLRRSVVKTILGIVVLSQAVNLLILTASGLKSGAVPFVEGDSTGLAPSAADPLPQALILTAIVISFGVLAFTLAMVQRVDQAVGTDDLDEMNSTDQ
ncbi:MAG: NADH-quinone oxidoreductase subunit K [Terrimicrobiaceae bacterium]|nr:NADH-quinone oxidoreductase subunit K [Terrimicrobiaceae bacterium]